MCGGIARLAHACKRVDVGVRPCEAVRKRHEERNDLVLLGVRQAEHTRRRVEIVPDLGHRPAVYFFGRSRREVSGNDRLGKPGFPRVVEMYELLEPLDVPFVDETLLKVRPGRLGGGALDW